MELLGASQSAATSEAKAKQKLPMDAMVEPGRTVHGEGSLKLFEPNRSMVGVVGLENRKNFCLALLNSHSSENEPLEPCFGAPNSQRNAFHHLHFTCIFFHIKYQRVAHQHSQLSRGYLGPMFNADLVMICCVPA